MARIGSKVQDALNAHVRSELESAYRYLAASSQLQAEGYEGMAIWMRAQAQEELGHAMRFYDHVFERGGQVRLESLEAPHAEFGTPREAFTAALEREESTTASIHDLVGLANSAPDLALHNFLQWFVQEQVKEEDQLRRILDRFDIVGEQPAGLLMLDNELRARGAA